jgi:hypothetical protein
MTPLSAKQISLDSPFKVFAERPVFWLLNFQLFPVGQPFCEGGSIVQTQRQHFKPPLKITEKRTLFSRYRFFMANTVGFRASPSFVLFMLCE